MPIKWNAFKMSEAMDEPVAKLAISGFKSNGAALSSMVFPPRAPVTPEVLLMLTELKFDAVTLAFQSIKLSLGMPLVVPRLPNQAFLITDAFMYVD